MTTTLTRPATTETAEACPACRQDHRRGTACTVSRDGIPLTLVCPRCRWIYGAVPTACIEPGSFWNGEEVMVCAACGLAGADRWPIDPNGPWNEPRRPGRGPSAGELHDHIRNVVQAGWYVSPQVIAITTGRYFAERYGYGQADFYDIRHRLRVINIHGPDRDPPLIDVHRYETVAQRFAGVAA